MTITKNTSTQLSAEVQNRYNMNKKDNVVSRPVLSQNDTNMKRLLAYGALGASRMPEEMNIENY